jgi:hypothetical protein
MEHWWKVYVEEFCDLGGTQRSRMSPESIMDRADYCKALHNGEDLFISG